MIEAATGSVFTSRIAASSASAAVAWTTREKGSEALWVVKQPGDTPRRIAVLVGDTGDTIRDPRLSPDGRWISWRTGPSDVPNGKTPNPAALAKPLIQQLWIARVEGGSPILLAQGGSGVSFSPQSTMVAYRAGGQLRLRSLGGDGTLGEEQSPLPGIPGLAEVAWSPDGKALAFTSYRRATSFIGIWRIGDERVRWLAPSFGRDGNPSFSPDGSRIAFLRRPQMRRGEVHDVMTGFPYSVWIGDVETLSANEAYRTPARDGSEQYGKAPLWLSETEVAFLSDETGYSHVWKADAQGNKRQLTFGKCDVEKIDRGPETLIVSSNCNDIYRRDVALLDSEGEFRRISPPQAAAVDGTAIGNTGQVLFRFADAAIPYRVASWKEGGGVEILSLATPARGFQVPEVVTFTAADGTEVSGTLFKAQGVNGPAPTAIFLHGGPPRQMMPTWHRTSYYSYTYAMNQVLAQRGMNVLAVNFRTGIGFGQAFRNAPGYGPHGAAELQDVLAAEEYLLSRADVDAARIGVYGGSYGGHLSALALARHSDRFKTAVVWHPVADWTNWIRRDDKPDLNYTPWGITEETLELARESSALWNVDTWQSPVLLIVGDDDRQVLAEESIWLHRALQDQGVPAETMMLPGEGHGFLRHDNWLRVLTRSAEWLEAHLAAED
ncbi:MAG: prolyl oligopeptidase family serine peptidase [Erythrobacter sp.]|nr:prolyl oligopeptidase family serine peptidase [Erythrobacter sp.]